MAVNKLLLLTLICVTGQSVWSYNTFKNDLSWLEKFCKSDSDCDADLAVCFKGKCLCKPGYYYSRTRNICLDMCAYTDLQPTFIKYPGYAIDGFNMKSSEVTLLQDCMDQCIANPRCRSMEHVTTSKGACRLQPVTKLGAADSVWRAYSDWNYYQRTCL